MDDVVTTRVRRTVFGKPWIGAGPTGTVGGASDEGRDT
jgi:hypothetical protein